MSSTNLVLLPDEQSSIRWLTSPVTLMVIGPGPSASSGTALARDLGLLINARLPGVHIEQSANRLGIALNLADPADMAERTAAYLGLLVACHQANLEPRLIEAIDWFLKPVRDAWPSSWDARLDVPGFEARAAAISAAAAPFLAPFLDDPKGHGIGSARGFRLFHTGLSHIERHIVRTCILGTTKTRGGRASITGVRTPYSEPDLIAAAKQLVTAGWLEVLGVSRWNSSHEAGRGQLARGLADRDLLAE